MVRQYVGARYVPKFADPVAWTSGTSYEAMTIVTYNNSSYTSKMPVPATVGNPADNPDYWAPTGNYNAQVEQYRQETETVSNNLTTEITDRKNADTTLQGQITTVSNNLTREITNRKNADTTVSNNLTTEITNRKTADTTLQGNINSEAATRALADSNLQSQINQIVAPSGEAPSAAEVQNARIGADGTIYDTLGNAIRGQVTGLKNKVDYIQKELISVLDDGSINIDGTFEDIFGAFKMAVVKTDGTYEPDTTWATCANIFKMPNGTKLTMNLNGLSTTYGIIWVVYNSDGTMKTRLFFNNQEELYYTFRNNESVRVGYHILSGTTSPEQAKLFSALIKYEKSYSDKVVSFMGDSITTYSGISESGYTEPVYPSGDVDSPDKTWWGIFKNLIGFANIGGISAMSRTSYRYEDNPLIIPGYDEDRIARLGANYTPDYIVINLGTNDTFQAITTPYNGSIDQSTLLDNKTQTGYACALTLLRIQDTYPNAKIIVIIPKVCNMSAVASGNFTADNYLDICEAIIQAAKHIGVNQIIDLRKCGINYTNAGQYTIDGIHPNAQGMALMGRYVAECFKKAVK